MNCNGLAFVDVVSSLNQTLRGIGWGGASTVINVVFQLMFMAVMARLLDPLHFGLIAMANVMLRFLYYFAQLGVGPALIQKPELVDGDVRAALSVSIGISTLCIVLAILAAPLAQRYFEMPELALVIQVLSINFLLGGLSTVSLSLLRREMRFKEIAWVESISYIVGYGLVGIGLALLGFGVWSLVGAVLGQSLLTVLLGFYFSRHELGVRHQRSQRNHFFSFGATYSLIGFVEFLSGSIDALIVGKLFGTAATGIYGRASLLANLPVQQPANIVTRALFPILSRLGSARQIHTLQIGTLVIGSYALATTLGMIAAANDIVLVMLGEKWIAAIPILQLLALAVAPQYLSHLIGINLDAMGELRPKLLIQTGVLVLLIIAFVVLKPYGIQGIAMAIVLAEWCRFVLMSGLIIKLLHPPLREFRLIFSIILINGLTAFGLISLVAQIVFKNSFNWVHLIVEIIAGVVALVGSTWLCRRLVGSLPVMADLINRLPILRKFFPVPSVPQQMLKS